MGQRIFHVAGWRTTHHSGTKGLVDAYVGHRHGLTAPSKMLV